MDVGKIILGRSIILAKALRHVRYAAKMPQRIPELGNFCVPSRDDHQKKN
jgi:hypothetical protein